MTKSEAERVLGELQHGRPRYQWAGRSQVADLELRIRLVAAWCSKFLDPGSIAQSLRPPRLAPHPLYGDRWDAVDDVSRAREREMPGDAIWNAPRLDGRWLTYFPDADLADGAAEAATNGFLDAHNAPPWGTWLGYFDDRTSDPSYSSYLVAWVPLSLVRLVDQGIDVNPESCIVWLSDANVRLREVMAHVAGAEAV